MAKTFTVQVVQTINVTVDESKFNEEFFAEFRESFFHFFDLEDHVQHLAQMAVRGVANDRRGSFIEGYGPPQDMGIKFEEGDLETEIVEPRP